MDRPLSSTSKSQRDLRNLIDTCDEDLLRLLSVRFQLIQKMGEQKRAQKKSIEDVEREQTLFLKWQELGESFGLNSDLLQEVFQVILRHSRKIQGQIHAETKVLQHEELLFSGSAHSQKTSK